MKGIDDLTDYDSENLLELQFKERKKQMCHTCNQGWLRHLSTLYLFLILTWRRLLIRSVAAEELRVQDKSEVVLS